MALKGGAEKLSTVIGQKNQEVLLHAEVSLMTRPGNYGNRWRRWIYFF